MQAIPVYSWPDGFLGSIKAFGDIGLRLGKF
jgi:hypothetical protein